VRDFKRIVIGVDPAISKEGCETGIIVCGQSHDNNIHILDDLSGRYTPCEWVSKVGQAYETYKADHIIAEVNQGGSLIKELFYLQNETCLPIKDVFAKRGKITRAEPVIALYEQKRIFHKRYFKSLETQLLTYKPGRSADRLDALVWGVTELVFQGSIKMTWL